MINRLHWREAEHRDRTALQQFRCTPKLKKGPFWTPGTPRPREWEWTTQGWLKDLRPPSSSAHLMLIGEDSHGIGAAAHAEDLDGPALVHVHALGVHVRLRGRGRGYGDALFNELLDQLSGRADAAGAGLLRVVGYVHKSNTASKRLLIRQKADIFKGEDTLDEFALAVDLS